MTLLPLQAQPERSLVLVVDDQSTVRLAVTAALQREGFRVVAVADVPAALASLERDRPAIAIIDIGLAGMDGLDGLALLREIRRAGDLPVILLTARDEEVDRVVGLELGADDYVAKPFYPRELVARVRSLLRRAQATAPGRGVAAVPAGLPARPAARPAAQQAPGRLEFDGLVIDPDQREVTIAGRLVETTRREFDLLFTLASAPRRVFTREQLLRSVWGSSSESRDPATVTEHVRRLRLKVESDPANPRWIETARGVGYRFVP